MVRARSVRLLTQETAIHTTNNPAFVNWLKVKVLHGSHAAEG